MAIRYFRLLVLMIGFVHCQQAGAQNQYKDTFYLNYGSGDHLTEYYTYYLPAANENLSPSQIDQLYQQGKFKHWKWHYSFNPGYVPNDIWMRVVVKNTNPAPTTYLWTVHNYLDTISLYKKVSDSFALVSTTTGKTIAENRPFNTRNLSLPFTLDSGEVAVLYLRMVCRAETVYVITNINSELGYLLWEGGYFVRSNWYWLIGFFLFAALFNFILYFFLQDKVHLWYAGYVVCSFLFLFMEDEFDSLVFPSFLYRFEWSVGQITFLLLGAVCGLGIMQAFIKQKGNSKLFRWCRWTMYIDTAFAIIYAITHDYFKRVNLFKPALVLSEAIHWLFVATILLTLVSLIEGVWKKNRLAVYYLIAFSFFLVGSGFFFLNDLGITLIHHLKPNVFAIALFCELTLLLFFITLRFRSIIREMQD